MEGRKMKDAYYFSHDCNARNDPKILAMRSKYGSEGYGWYWMIIEILREQPEYKLENNKYLCITLAMQLQCDNNAVHGYVENCINEYKLFESDGKYFWSNSLIRRMSQKDSKSEKARRAANARWHKGLSTKNSNGNNDEKNNDNACAMPKQCGSNAIKEKKVKESKVKESKEESTENSLSDKAIELCKYYQELKPAESITSQIGVLEIFIDTYGFDWTKEAIQKCVGSKNKFIKPWIEKVLQNWTTEGKPKEVEHGQTKQHRDSSTDPNREGIGIEL